MGPCPLCGHALREEKRTGFNRCDTCGSVVNPCYSQGGYGKDYFFQEYENRYGRSYEEDIPVIYELSCRRMDSIQKMASKRIEEMELFEIGCALGAFLTCARDRGAKKVRGLEISSWAVDYCRKKELDVREGSFEKHVEDEPCDVLAAWFVLEHFENPGKALGKLESMLKPGGVLALSLPSIRGPLFTLHPYRWKKSHPADHRIDIDPFHFKKHLLSIGFRKVLVMPGGIHPDRVMKPENLLYHVFKRVYGFWARWAVFSDTVEVYALK
jgi:SAM-dependent methyltransferase